MIKKVLPPGIIAIFFWGIGLLITNQYFYEYLRAYLYISIIATIGYVVFDKIKEDKD